MRYVAGVALCVLVASCSGNGTPESTVDAANADTGTGPATIDISGFYQVSSDLEGPCGAPVASNLGPKYVWAERRVSIFVLHACSGSTEASCTGTLFYDFTQPIDNGWSAAGGSAFFSAGCTLSYERTTLTLAGGALSAKALRQSANRDIAQSACTLDAARALTDACAYEIDLAATRLAGP